MGLSADLIPSELEAEPGTAAAFTLEVEADASAPADVRLEVAGLAVEWALIVPPQLSVPAGGRARARVVVNVPRSPHVAPGSCPVTVTAVGEGAQVEAHGEVRIRPFADVRAGFSPRVSKGRNGAAYTLHVENQGNEAVEATLEPGESDRGLAVDAERTKVTLAPGEVAAVPVRVRSRRGRYLGGPRSRQFAVAVRTGGHAAPAVTAEGIFVQEKRRWPLPLGLVLAVAGAGGGKGGGGRAGPAVPAAAAAAVASVTPAQSAACPVSPSGSPDLLVQNSCSARSRSVSPRGRSCGGSTTAARPTR